MNNGLTFAFLVIVVVMCTRVAMAWIKTRNSRSKADADAELEFGDTLVKIQKLEERIQVLERIVTERPYDLKREIDSL